MHFAWNTPSQSPALSGDGNIAAWRKAVNLARNVPTRANEGGVSELTIPGRPRFERVLPANCETAFPYLAMAFCQV